MEIIWMEKFSNLNLELEQDGQISNFKLNKECPEDKDNK